MSYKIFTADIEESAFWLNYSAPPLVSSPNPLTQLRPFFTLAYCCGLNLLQLCLSSGRSAKEYNSRNAALFPVNGGIQFAIRLLVRSAKVGPTPACMREMSSITASVLLHDII